MARRHRRGLGHVRTPQLPQQSSVRLEEVELLGERADGEVEWLRRTVRPSGLELCHVAADHVVVNDGVVRQEAALGRVHVGLFGIDVPEVDLLVVRGTDKLSSGEVEPLYSWQELVSPRRRKSQRGESAIFELTASDERLPW